MDLSKEKLTDLTTGWHRHPDDDGIILVDHIEIFKAAANDASCRAAILKVSDEKKTEDREAFKALFNTGRFKNVLEETVVFIKDQGLKSRKFDPEPALRCALAEHQLTEIALHRLSLEEEGAEKCLISLIPKWRHLSGQKGHTHSYHVLGRVFFSGGTIFPTNLGAVQSEEGDYSLIKAGCPHNPETATKENVNKDRLSIGAYVDNANHLSQ